MPPIKLTKSSSKVPFVKEGPDKVRNNPDKDNLSVNRETSSKYSLLESSPSSRSSTSSCLSVHVPEPGVRTLLLKLPLKIRIMIWKTCGFEAQHSLRLTCSQIHKEIDQKVGISARVREKDPSFSFYGTVAIRRLVLDSLGSLKITKFIQKPELLLHLSIHGSVSEPYFKYVIQSCPNLEILSLDFNKSMIKNRPGLFPQPSLVLSKVKALRIIAHTKKEKELIYICDNVAALLKGPLMDAKISELHVSLSHTCGSPYLQEMLFEVIVFVHKNCRTLEDCFLVVKEKDLTLAKQMLQQANEEDEEDDSKRRGTPATATLTKDLSSDKKKEIEKGAESSMSIASSTSKISAADFAFDKQNSSLMEAAESYLKRMSWPVMHALRRVNLACHSEGFQYLEEMLKQSLDLESAELEVCGGNVINCWLSYAAILPCVCRTLTAVKLMGVSYEDYKQNALDIDFSVFKTCTGLKVLYIICLRREVTKLPWARSIGALPRTLEHLELGWMYVSVWQVFRLLFCFRHLHQLYLSYTTKNDRSFAGILTIMRILMGWGCSPVTFVVVTDTKIRFRNRRGAVKRLKRSLPVDIKYYDRDETLLTVDTRRAPRASTVSLPSI